MKKKDNQRRWRIELTEEQLRVAIEAIEDWHRFISGQCEMDYATSYIDNSNNMHKVRDILRNQVKPLMFPELDRAASYGWCGGQPNKHLSRVAAMSYMLYREVLHKLTLASDAPYWNVYRGETLTCEEQGPMIKVEMIEK